MRQISAAQGTEVNMTSNTLSARARRAGPLTPNRRSLLLGVPALLLLAACGQTSYTAPDADIAPKFDAAAPARSQTAPVWWSAFRDSRLDGLIQQGLSRNLSIAEAAAVIDEAEAGARLARAADLPNVSVQGSASRGNPEGARVVESSAGSLSTSWMIDLFGGNQAARAAAIAELDAARLSADAAKLSVTSAIALAYIDLRYYQESISLTRRSIESRRQTLSMTRTMVEAGQAGRLEVLQAEQAVAQAEAGLPALEVGFDQAINRLATLTASRSGTLRPNLTKGGGQPHARFRPNVGVPADVIRARPDVRMAERRFAAATARVGVAEAAFYPSIQLTGNITPTNLRRGGNVTTWGFGPQINLPIFSGGANQANLKGAEARAAQAHVQWRASVLNAVEEVENGLVSYNRGSVNVAAQQRLVDSTNQTLSLSRTSYEAGEVDLFRILDAERDLLSARQALATANRTLASDFVRLSIAAAANPGG